MWHWITQTNAGLAARLAAGAVVFSILAIVDWRRRGPQATRWREYLFLLACVSAALLYGIVNDIVTSTISWEYFCYGKGLWPDVIHDLPPEPMTLYVAAAGVGMKATWTVGLVIGVALLQANNPSRTLPQLPYPKLLKMLGLILVTAALSALILGTAGYLGWLAHFSDDFTTMLQRDEMRPHRFIAVFGIHLGGYIGGLLGTIITVAAVRHRRRGLGSAFKTSAAPLATHA